MEEKKQKEEKTTTDIATSTIAPLTVGATKRSKVGQDSYVPDMTHIASRILSDPFVVRILADGTLRYLRVAVFSGAAVPAAHAIVPSLVQLLHFARSNGIMPSVDDPSSPVWISLRQRAPLLVRLLVEAEIDQRIATGGDWNAVRDRVEIPPTNEWDQMDEVSEMLFQGALVFLCRQRSDVSVSFPKFAAAIERCDELFLTSLRQAILRHKTKMPKSARDSILNTWLDRWLARSHNAHAEFMALLNDWANLGNAVVPRDAHLLISQRAVETYGKEEFLQSWGKADDSFSSVKYQYERMLEKILPADSAAEWKKQVGIDMPEGEPMEVDNGDGGNEPESNGDDPMEE